MNQLLLRYIHVSMATLLQRRLCMAVRKRRGEGSRERRSLPGLAEMLGSGDVRAGARQRARDDSVAVTMKYSLHLRPQRQQSSYPAATQQQTAPFVVGTLEVGFLLLFQSLSHPSVSILLTDLSPACPCVAPCSALQTQKGKDSLGA